MAAGVAGKRHHSAFHGLFATARWSLDHRSGFALFELSAAFRPKEGPVALTLDDTLAHKRGKASFGAGMHHDNARSSRKVAVLSYGHSWVVLAVIVRLPCVASWCHRVTPHGFRLLASAYPFSQWWPEPVFLLSAAG